MTCYLSLLPPHGRSRWQCVLPVLLTMLMLCSPTLLWARHNNLFNEVRVEALPPLEVTPMQGVSAPFCGVASGLPVVVGGCNFPHIPAAMGGSKCYYPCSFWLTPQGWAQGPEIPARAYGMSVQVPEGVLLIGGMDAHGPTTLVQIIMSPQVAVARGPLPQLPRPMHSAAAGYDGHYVYVAGGEAHLAYRLRWPDGQEWEPLPPMPGRPRVQPAGVVQYAALDKQFYLLGGYAPSTAQDTAYVHSDGLWFDTAHHRWMPVAPAVIDNQERAIVGATAVPSGVSHVLVFGGVDRQVFLDALNRPDPFYLRYPTEWYRFNAELLVYQTITDVWTAEGHSPRLARAGAAVIPHQGGWYVVGGEEKPGVRSADVSRVWMESRTTFGWLNWLVLILYLGAMVAMGYFFMRRERTSEQFFKGGGRIPWWAAGISIYATMLSAITYMAIPAKSYATNWTYYPMLVTILLMAFPVIRYYLPHFRKLNITSAYEYLELRFNTLSRLTASALFIVFMVARTALVLYLPSLALTAVTGINIYLCIALMGIITVVYCTMGGVEAVIWGDVVQGLILVGGAFVAAAYLILNTGNGAANFVQVAVENDKFRLFDFAFDFSSATIWVILLGGMANNLISYTSDQTVIQRYITTPNERGAARGILMNGVMSVTVSAVFYLIGTGLYTFFKTHPTDMDYTMAKTDAIFPFFMMSQMPAGLAGLLIAAIFSATMSTVSSNINSVATAFSIDFFKRFRRSVSDRALLLSARWACVLSGMLGMGLALMMATWQIHSLLDYFNTILGLLSSGIGALFFMGVFCPRIGGKAAMTGFVVGEGVVFWLFACSQVSFLLFGFIGMAVSVAVAWLASFFFPRNRAWEGYSSNADSWQRQGL